MENKNKRSLRDYFIISAKGMSMGAADVVPGVSGGTMAFILGIYEELITSIRKMASVSTIKMLLSFKFKQAFEELPWRFLAALATGILVAILSLAKLFKWALETHPEMIWGFFFGLVLASIITVHNKVSKWNAKTVSSAVLGAVVAFLIVGMIPGKTPEAWWFVIISGSVAISAMILPGISGSFILLLMGKYHYILTALTALMGFAKDIIKGEATFTADIQNSIITISSFVVGIVAGLASFVQFLSWLFKKYHDVTIAVLIGFMVGSLRKIWPWKETIETYLDRHGKVKPLIQNNIIPESFGSTEVIIITLIIVGFVTVISLEKFASAKPKKEEK